MLFGRSPPLGRLLRPPVVALDRPRRKSDAWPEVRPGHQEEIMKAGYTRY
jgi:hypothetical protein